ncbi:MAG: ATP-binding protein [Cyanobacteriota bacterium]|nr:ATP-binding protein [Cyanobacteriota bacterium]
MSDETIEILVVDDDEVDRMAVQRALKKAGVQAKICAAENCKSAIATLQNHRFDCIFIDYRLPDGDGLQLIRQIRANLTNVPIIALTGQGGEQVAVELMKAGASDYLAKRELSPETLSRSLHSAVRVYRAEQQALQANQRLRESEERYRLVVEGSNDGIWDWDLETHRIYSNDRLLNLLGFSAGEIQIDSDLIRDLLHPEDRQRVIDTISEHLQGGDEEQGSRGAGEQGSREVGEQGSRGEIDISRVQAGFEIEFRVRHRSGEYRYCMARGKARRDASGKSERLSGVVRDITERKRAEERSHFLAEASRLLSLTLDSQTALENLARLTVPHLADWCAIDLFELNQFSRRIAVAHGDREKEPLIWQLQGCSWGSLQVLQSGKSDACFEVPQNRLQGWAREKTQRQLLETLGFRSYLCVPLEVSDRILGSILLVWSESGRFYQAEDLELAEDLAHRAALAMENARLYREAQQASQNLRLANAVLQQQKQQLSTLQQLTNVLNQRLTDLTGLLRVMVQSVGDAIAGAQLCFITLFNAQCNEMVLTVATGEGVENLSLEKAFSANGWLQPVFLTGKSYLIPDRIQVETQLPAAIYAVALESVRSGHLGALAIANWDDPEAFSEEDCHLLAAVGEQAAIAIDNARLIKTLEEREERLEQQNQILAQQNAELDNQRRHIERQNVQLTEAARMKSQFIAMMSHELRTPMNAIIGFSQVLLRQRSGSLVPHQKEMIGRILNNGKSLLKLINDILDLSKMEAGRLELQCKEFNLAQLVNRTLAELRSLADEKQLTLAFESRLENPTITNDRDRLRQILVNLLSNAIKFTATGSVIVKLSQPEPGQIAMIVEDTGIGISPEQQTHIFDEFHQVDQTTTRKYSGTGLGLAITESLVRLMKGRITIASQLGQGSAFCVQLPREI